jgi:hypothetical protein
MQVERMRRRRTSEVVAEMSLIICGIIFNFLIRNGERARNFNFHGRLERHGPLRTSDHRVPHPSATNPKNPEQAHGVWFRRKSSQILNVAGLHPDIEGGLAAIDRTQNLWINRIEKRADALLQSVVFGDLLSRFLKLFSQLFDFSRVPLLRFSICAVSLFALSSNCFAAEPFMALPVEIGQQFKAYDGEKENDPTQLKEVVEPPSIVNRVPSRQPSHDDALPVIIAVGAAFLAGFRIAA